MKYDKWDLMHNKKSQIKSAFKILRDESACLGGNPASVDAFETKAFCEKPFD